MKPCCYVCRYWYSSTGKALGECRRGPPVNEPDWLWYLERGIRLPPNEMTPRWPRTDYSEWCGEFRRRSWLERVRETRRLSRSSPAASSSNTG